ncbi:MAG: sugar ABC transporter ATP-binding protein [Abditibacteriota bacterium]|nr:sugar ABC transporter ATP-binding protein [Abditibacteriota bacterium]
MNGEYIVQMSHIVKTFPGVRALDDVSFNLKSGEVLALLGENGAGKSTLMKILRGVQGRDSGEMIIFGKPCGDLTPQSAAALGIAMIHQELNMCGHLTVAENIFLGREPMKGMVVDRRKMNEETREVLARLNMDISPDTVVGNLAVSKQQMVEIAKALSADAEILIMDEPTSALTAKEIEDLFEIIRKLRSEGKGIVYISHRLEELEHIADRVTIMRDGKYISSSDFKDTTMDSIIADMVGREITEKFPKARCERGKKILEVKRLSAGKAVKDVSFDLYEGEILGVAGLMGAGRTEMTRALFGADKKDSGEVVLDGKTLKINSPRDAIKAGIVLAPEDRKKDGLCTRLPVRENISLPNLDMLSNLFGKVNRRKEADMVSHAVSDFKIKLPTPEVDADTLSGGNQQKVVVAKWLSGHSRVVIFDEPTRGIDVAAKVEIYRLMNELKLAGMGVMFVSSEMPEVMGVSDRIIVMCGGRVTGEMMAEDATQEEILRRATDFSRKEATDQ